MHYQSINNQDNFKTGNLNSFILGMVIAFLISIAFSYGNSTNMDSTHALIVDCDNPVSLSKAQDRSRNGIANYCL